MLKLLKETGALLEGHFILSSGLHSGKYLQCALIFQHPKYAQKLCEQLAKRFSAEGGSAKGRKKRIDVVIAPAIGGILVSYELARALGARSIFAERKDGKMQLRRNFKIKKGEKVLVAEDVITTGGSTKEIVGLAKEQGGNIVAVACIINRSEKKDLFGSIKLDSLYKMKIETYPAKGCPLCKKNIPVDKPGSRR